jgi:hypothetical protein
MRTKLFATALALFALISKNYCQFSFGVSPGIGLNSAYFGYKISEKVIPFIGIQYLYGSLKYEERGEEFDDNLNKLVPVTKNNELSGNLLIPNIGLKYFLKQQNKIQAYISICISKPLLSGELKEDGEVDKDVKKLVDNLSMWGGECGFGVEYFFDENFSIGGEFGIRYLNMHYEEFSEDEIYNSNTGQYLKSEVNKDYKLNLSPTFSKLSVNFYF